MALLTAWWPRAMSLHVGTVMPVTAGGVPELAPELAKTKQVAHSALRMHSPTRKSGNQLLQRTLSCWHSGTTIAMQSRGCSLT